MTPARLWTEAERYALQLVEYTRPELLPLCDFLIARAGIGRGHRSTAMLQELRRLRDEAKRIGLNSDVPALEAALAAAG